MLFICFITHGYLPEDFMKPAIVSIIKNKTGDSTDKGNYRPIALVTACSKVLKISFSKMLETYLETDDHQFGFKSQHAKDMCIFTVKSVIKYYTKQNSSVFTCFLDAAKAFDRVSHWTLFSKMIQRNILLVIAQIIAFGIKPSLCALNGENLTRRISKFEMVYAKAECDRPNSLLYTCILMIYLKILLCVNLVAILMDNV